MLELEKSDLGCGAGGGQNNVNVFRLAGLTFLTNANADDSKEAGNLSPFNHEGVNLFFVFLQPHIVSCSYYVAK